MSVFKKTLTDLGQFAIDKKNQVAQTSQTKAVLDAEKEKLASAYTALGNAYFQLHQYNPEPELAVHISTINGCLLAIEECNRQIQIAERGGLACSNCGAMLAPGASFCGSCGTPAGNPANANANEELICPQCGSQTIPQAAFCGGCGYQLNATSVPQVPQAQLSPQVDVAQLDVSQTAAPRSSTCPYCNTEVDPSDQICTTCGSPLS